MINMISCSSGPRHHSVLRLLNIWTIITGAVSGAAAAKMCLRSAFNVRVGGAQMEALPRAAAADGCSI